jgi:uncharacterized protein (TIGR03435 family)
MLLAPLIERFALKYHREVKVQTWYALLVGEGGARLRPSTLVPKPLQPSGKTDDTGPATQKENGLEPRQRSMLFPHSH